MGYPTSWDRSIVENLGKTQTPAELARLVSSKLLAEGFTVHRLEWRETGSVYLAVDYGLMGQIRVSGHPNRRGKACKYNIGTWIEKTGHDRNYALRYYPVDQLPALVDDIVADRERRMELYGIAGYAHRMDDLRKKANWEMRSHTGFFAHARRMKMKRRGEA